MNALSRREFRTHWLVLLALSAAPLLCFAQDELPKKGTPDDTLDFEPNLKLYDVRPEPGSGKIVPWEQEEIPPDETKAKADAERARRKAERWQQLQRKGVVSKVEVERAVSVATRASLRYQRAHVVTLRNQLEALRQRAGRGEASPDLVESAATALASAERLAAEAEAAARKTDLEFARNNLERQQLLLRAGLGSRAQLSRAQAELARLEQDAAGAGAAAGQR